MQLQNFKTIEMSLNGKRNGCERGFWGLTNQIFRLKLPVVVQKSRQPVEIRPLALEAGFMQSVVGRSGDRQQRFSLWLFLSVSFYLNTRTVTVMPCFKLLSH